MYVSFQQLQKALIDEVLKIMQCLPKRSAETCKSLSLSSVPDFVFTGASDQCQLADTNAERPIFVRRMNLRIP